MSTPPQGPPKALRNDLPKALRNDLPDALCNDSPDALADALITRVLTGLRDTQPSPGMNDRILHTLQAHSAAARADDTQAQSINPRRFQVIHLAWKSGRLPLAAAFAAALLVAALITLHPHRTVRITAQLSPPYSIPAAPRPAPAALAHAQPAHPIGVPHPSRVLLRGAWAPTTPNVPSTPTDPLAAEALADTIAPSHPAPPLPLTPEEKRLLRVLQRNDPVELAQLDPVHLAASLARDQAEYRKFFTPPPPLPQNPTSEPTPATPSSGDQL